MHKKGIIFSLAALILILTFIALSQTIIRTTAQQSQTEKTMALMRNLSQHYSSIESNIITLDTKSAHGKIQERALPFEYNVDTNHIELQYNTPIRATTIGHFFDIINAFEIFIEDQNYSNSYSGIATQVDTEKNSPWGGTQTTLNFIVEPQCTEISVRQTGITFGQGWCGTFDLNSASRIDTNISIYSPSEDLNSFACRWNSTDACPSQSFDPSNPNPYFSLQIFDENCTSCGFLQNTVSGHFDISQNNWIAIICTGAECTATQIDINAAQYFSISRNSNALPVQISTGMLMKNKITGFYFNDMNITVSNNDFNISMRTTR